MRKNIKRNKIIHYFTVWLCLIIFTCCVFSKSTAIAFLRRNGGNENKLTADYNTNKVKEFCDDYCLYFSEATRTNTEHIFANSWTEEKYKNDYFNLRVADFNVNSVRGNLGYNNVLHNAETEVKNKATGEIIGWKDDKFFEPLDEYKGDVARTLLYVYYNYGLTKDDIKDKFNLRTMVKWAKLDKVNAEEKEFAKKISEKENYNNLFITNEKIIYLFTFVK